MKRSRESDNDEASGDDIGESALGDHESEHTPSEADESGVDGALTADIKLRLRNCLDYMSTTMSFASSGPCPIEVNPVISISELGVVGLPLSERDAELISKVCHPAPYGKGSDTIVDPTVRRTKELNAEQFILKNPKWGKALEAIVSKAADELGVPGGAAKIKAVRYKLLLYEKGAMFKEHRDSEKEPGMFGTLVICLPSKHEGGEVHVTHGGKAKTLETAESSEFGYTYLCWYGDVKHEIAEVTSGYRLVLTYNLVSANPREPATVPIELAGKVQELEDILSFWKKNYNKNTSGCPTVLAYILEHLYTEWTLSYSGLKGSDRLRGECLLELCKKHGFLFYMAELEREVHGLCDDEINDESEWSEMYFRAIRNKEPNSHYISDVLEESLQLQCLVELDGTKLLDGTPFRKSKIIQNDAFNGDPDEEDFSGPTGNEGVTATHFYHRSVAILMPAEYRIDFFFQSYKTSETDMCRWMDQLIKQCDLTKADISAERDLRKACQLITRGSKSSRTGPRNQKCFTDHLLGKVMSGGLHLNDRNLCSEAISAVVNQLPQPTTIEVIQRFGFTQLKNKLDTTICSFVDVHQSLGALLGIYDGYRDLEGHDSQNPEEILEWIQSQARNICVSKRMNSTEDGAIAAEVGIRCGEIYVVEQLASAFKSQIQNTKRGVFGFLTGIAEGWKSEEITHKATQDIFCTILQDFIPSIRLVAAWDEGSKRVRISSTYIPSTLLNSKNIIQLLRQCVSLDLGCQAHQLLDKLEELAINEEPAIAFKGFFLPLAKELYGMAADQNSGAAAQGVKNKVHLFSEKLLDLYTSRCVGPKPAPPIDWRRTKCGCGCTECLQLDSFLVNPVQEHFQISVESEDRTNHLKDRLPRIHQCNQKGAKPEHDTKVMRTPAGFDLLIHKTRLAWSIAVKYWEKDQDAAKKWFDSVFNDEGMKKILEGFLERLS